MDVVVPSICLSSVAGAILFYAGGRLQARPAPEAPRQPESVELEAERAARRHAEEETAGALRATRDAVAALAEERVRSTDLREALSVERDARARADAEAASERRRLLEEAARPMAEATAAERRLAELGAELERLRADAGRARVEAAQARAETERATAAARRLSTEAATLRTRTGEQARLAAEIEATRARVAEAEARAAAAEVRTARAEAKAAGSEGLREENRRLERAVAALEQQRAATPDLAEVQRRALSATMALRTLEQRSEEITRREAENADLRRRVEALSGAAAEVEPLRRRVRELEALGFAEATHGWPTSDDDEPTSQGLENDLVAGLRELCQREAGCRAAVLSDLRGLLIAAHGDAGHRLELAAAAALTTTTAERLRELLPLGEPVSFALVDANAIVFRTRWLRWEDEGFLLSTLGAAPAADAADAAPVEALHARLAALLGRG